MRLLDAFWRSLDHIVGCAASAYDWREALRDEWAFAERFLKVRGNLVLSIGCPSPGGDGCPRQVVRTGPETFRAVCGNAPRECVPLDLTLGDVTILALDTRRLATEIAIALEIDLDYRERRGVIHLGQHLVAAGTGFSVDLVVGSAAWRPPLRLHDFDDPPGAVLMSSPSSMDPNLQTQLRTRRHRIFLLGEVVGSDDGRLVPLVEPAVLFRDLREQTAGPADRVPRPPWTLPAGTTWEKLKFDLVARDKINVSTAGRIYPLRPDHIGLRNEKTGGFAEGWILLTSLVAMRGGLSLSHPTNANEKQMQLLGAALRDRLGVKGLPFLKLKRGEYAAKFVAVCSLPEALAEISGDELAGMRKKSAEPPRRKPKRAEAK